MTVMQQINLGLSCKALSPLIPFNTLYSKTPPKRGLILNVNTLLHCIHR
jgi:hypothetical protein